MKSSLKELQCENCGEPFIADFSGENRYCPVCKNEMDEASAESQADRDAENQHEEAN